MEEVGAPRLQLPWWRILGQEEAERSKRAADWALNTPITSDEVAAVLENPNGKSI